MDSPAVTQLFRQLFSHQTCARSSLARLHGQRHCQVRSQRRARHGDRKRLSNSEEMSWQDWFMGRGGTEKNTSNWQQRLDTFAPDRTQEFKTYPMVDIDWLKTRKRRPRRVKMLLRDFVEDSLYNPNYGYFSKQAVIFSPKPFDFPSLRNEAAFHAQLGQEYTRFEDELDRKEIDNTRQLWHTPTELFQPYYGEAIARYLVENYKLSMYPYHDLLLYEMGAGNGTLMINVLDYIRDVHPEVYERTRYNIIEISSSLAALQTSQLQRKAGARGHADKVTIINKSIFDWDIYVSAPCFFLALEVWDNFAHDALRYDSRTWEALQSHVLIDTEGEFFDFYTRQLDPAVQRFLRVRDTACQWPYRHPLREGAWKRRIMNTLNPDAQLTQPEYIPTRLIHFFDILYNYFPGHKLVASDFHKLPDAVKGVNAPVVQTRYKRTTVPVRTPLVHQGYFDILFPTDFAVMEDIYRAVTGKLTRTLLHEDFMKSWAYLEETRTKNGENPMLSWYKNASVMVTV